MECGPGHVGQHEVWLNEELLLQKEILMLNGDISLNREPPKKRPLKALPASKMQRVIEQNEMKKN
jgi:hypothetical protein